MVEIDKATHAAITAYAIHFERLWVVHRAMKRERSTLDLTIALRLRVTGHAQEHIEAAVRAMARGALKNPADAEGYARRIAAYPFSKDGEADYERLRPSRLEWVALEEEQLLSPAQRAKLRKPASAPARPSGRLDILPGLQAGEDVKPLRTSNCKLSQVRRSPIMRNG
ncbi:hypothetical protein [Thiobacillus sp.]